MAQFLLAQGFLAGDRLCVYLANCVDMIDVYLACIKTGIVFVPVNILYRDREIAHIIRDAEPRAVVADETISASLPAWTRTDLRAAIQNSPSVRPAISLDGDAIASII